ncbi:MAG: hypothetical protein ACJ780_02360, partial [Solirubrobacteraceae bacterium]
MGRRTARLIFTVLALLTVGLAGSAAASAQLRWTGALLHDTAGSGPALTALACPSATLCVAVDAAGGAVAFNPSAPAPQTPVTIDTTLVTDVSCSSAARCVAVDAGGREVTFNPMDLGAAVATAVDPGEILFSVSCPPGGSACAAVDG